MPVKRRIKAITFDLDNTLWNTNDVILAAENALYSWLKEHATRLTDRFNPNDLRAQRLALIKRKPDLSHQISQLRIESLKLSLIEVGYNKSESGKLSTLAFDFFYAERQKVKPFPQVEKTLATLKKHYHIGSVTNGNANLTMVGLDKYFDFSLSAEQVGANKPSSKIFGAALHSANCEKHELIHVGDHPIDDIIGAKDFGFHTIWVNYAMNEWDLEEKPTQEVKQFNDLISAITTIETNLDNAY